MRILGIDPALKVTGYGVVDFLKPNKFTLISAGAIITSPKDVVPKRLEKIYQAMVELLSDTKPDVMVLEKVYVHYQHPTTAFILGQARGIICLACAKAKIPLVEYAATQVKKAIVGRGLSSKLQVQKMVLNTLKLKAIPRFTDVTDALALAITYSYMLSSRL